MRVVAGTARGRRLVTPDGDHVRPTSDRVREATFNALTSLGAVVDATVLDLFAGSGALAVEALSRGAGHATAVEPDRDARACIAANLAATGLAARADVVADTAEGYLARPPAAQRFDLVLFDPPYRYDAWEDLWRSIAPHVAPDAVAVVESDREPTVPDGWELKRSRRYGGTVVAVLIRTADGPRPSGAHA